MFVTRVISDSGLRIRDTGFDLDIRLPWYRSLPLSTVEIALLKLDRQAIDLGRITLELNGLTFTPESLKHHPEQWWFVLDSAFLQVRNHPLAPGSPHEVELTIGLYPPYIPNFHRLTECNKQLVAQ